MHAVQQPFEVRRAVGYGTRVWRGADCDGALRAQPVRRGAGTVDSVAARGQVEGPDVLSVRADPGAIVADAVSAGRDAEASSAGDGGRGWTGAGAEAGFAGDMLHSRGRLLGL